MQYIMILHTAMQWQQQNVDRLRIHKRHPISRPYGRAIGCRL